MSLIDDLRHLKYRGELRYDPLLTPAEVATFFFDMSLIDDLRHLKYQATLGECLGAQIWRSYDVDSGGSIVCRTLKALDAQKVADAIRSNSLIDEAPREIIYQRATQTTFGDGSVLTSPWVDIEVEG